MRSEPALRRADFERLADATLTYQALVVACGLNRHQRAYAMDGLRHRAACRFVETLDDLEALLRGATRIDVVVVTPEDVRGRSAVPLVERIAREWPDTAIVAFCPPRMDQAASLRGLVLAGTHQLVFEGVHDTASALATAVENARREVAGDAVYRRLEPLLPAQVQTMAQAVLARPDVMTSVEALANQLGVHRKTLVNRCARSRFVPPGELMVWCRLAMVAYLLDRTGMTVEAIGLELNYPSHTALRNQLKRYTGRTATAIRRSGAVDAVLGALRRRLPMA